MCPTDNDVVELEKLTVTKGQVTEKIVGLGLKSSYAYAPEQVKDKKMGPEHGLIFFRRIDIRLRTSCVLDTTTSKRT